MNNKTHIFFDVDGTLVNTEKSLLYCIDYAAKQTGIPEIPYETKLKFIGPPLLDSFMHYCGLDIDAARQAYGNFRKLYSTEGVHMAELYGGITDMLKALHKAGKKLYTASSKPEKFVKIILQEHGVADLFTDICGASTDESRTTKVQVLRYAIEKAHISDISECVLVGDRCFDANGAAELDMDCVGALWGFGSEDELRKSGCKHICAAPSELTRLFIG